MYSFFRLRFFVLFVCVVTLYAQATIVDDALRCVQEVTQQDQTEVYVSVLSDAASKGAESFFKVLSTVPVDERCMIKLCSRAIAQVLESAGLKGESCLLALISLGVGSEPEVNALYGYVVREDSRTADSVTKKWCNICKKLCAERLQQISMKDMPDSWY